MHAMNMQQSTSGSSPVHGIVLYARTLARGTPERPPLHQPGAQLQDEGSERRGRRGEGGEEYGGATDKIVNNSDMGRARKASTISVRAGAKEGIGIARPQSSDDCALLRDNLAGLHQMALGRGLKLTPAPGMRNKRRRQQRRRATAATRTRDTDGHGPLTEEIT